MDLSRTAAGPAAPAQLALRSEASGYAIGEAYRKTEPEAAARARKIQRAWCNLRPEMIGDHQLNGYCTKYSDAIEFATVQYELGKFCKVIKRGPETSGSVFEDWRLCRI